MHQLSFSGVGYGTPYLHTSSAKIVYLKDASHSGVCRHVYSHLLSVAWVLIYRWTRLASSFAGPSPLRCCTIGPLQVDVDVSVLRQSKNVWCVHSRFHGDGFWLSVPVFVGDLGYLMMFLLLSPSGFSGEVPGCNNSGLLMCPYWAQANGRYNRYGLKWRHLNAMDFNLIWFAILINCKVWATSVPNFSVM